MIYFGRVQELFFSFLDVNKKKVLFIKGIHYNEQRSSK